MRLYTLLSFLIPLCISNINAHGDLDIRIQAITSAIESNPDSAALYFTRGKLRFQHEEYQASIQDINHSHEKGYYHDLQKIYLAKSYFKLGSYEIAQTNLDDYLVDNQNNVVGLNLKARILYAQQMYEESALFFEKVIKLTIRSLPENYLEAAHSWMMSSHPNKIENTIQILELGLHNLGPIVTIQNNLIETHLKANNKDKALQIQFAIIDKTKRKETAYFKLAQLYHQLNDLENAKEAARNAQLHLKKLPFRIRKNSAMKQLENEILLFIQKLQ